MSEQRELVVEHIPPENVSTEFESTTKKSIPLHSGQSVKLISSIPYGTPEGLSMGDTGIVTSVVDFTTYEVYFTKCDKKVTCSRNCLEPTMCHQMQESILDSAKSLGVKFTKLNYGLVYYTKTKIKPNLIMVTGIHGNN